MALDSTHSVLNNHSENLTLIFIKRFNPFSDTEHYTNELFQKKEKISMALLTYITKKAVLL